MSKKIVTCSEIGVVGTVDKDEEKTALIENKDRIVAILDVNQTNIDDNTHFLSSCPSDSLPTLGVKHFDIYGNEFYNKVKKLISDNNISECEANKFEQKIMNDLKQDFEILRSVGMLNVEIKDINELYSLILSEAIERKDMIVYKTILHDYHPYVLTHTNKQHHNAILMTIRSRDNEKIIPEVSGYIEKYKERIQNEGALLSQDEILLTKLIDELTCNIPIEEHDNYLQRLLMPVYSDVRTLANNDI